MAVCRAARGSGRRPLVRSIHSWDGVSPASRPCVGVSSHLRGFSCTFSRPDGRSLSSFPAGEQSIAGAKLRHPGTEPGSGRLPASACPNFRKRFQLLTKHQSRNFTYYHAFVAVLIWIIAGGQTREVSFMLPKVFALVGAGVPPNIRKRKGGGIMLRRTKISPRLL